MDDWSGVPKLELKPVDETKTIDHFESRISRAREFCAEQWERSLDAQRWVDGGQHQWDPDDWKTRTSLQKPTYSLNDIVLAVNGLSGQEITQRYQPTFLPRSTEDGPWVGVLREVLRKIRDQAMAEHYESDKFRDTIIEGYGWTEWTMDYMNSGKGQLQVKGAPTWEMIWDPSASEMCLMDRMWDARGKFITIDEFLTMFPDKRDVAVGQLNRTEGWVDEATRNVTRWPWLYRIQGKYVEPQRREVFVVDYHFREREPAYMVQVLPTDEDTRAALQGGFDPPGPRNEVFNEDQFREYSDRHFYEAGERPAFVGPKDGLYRWIYKQAYIAGKEVLSESPLESGQFQRMVTTGLPDKELGVTIYRGLVHLMREGQRWKNNIHSLVMSYIERMPKMPIFVEPDALENVDQAEMELAKSAPFIKLRRGAISGGARKIEFGPMGQFPDALSQVLGMADTATWRPTGLNPQTLGSIGDMRRISGTVFDATKGAPAQVLSYLFDSYRLHRKLQAKMLLGFIKNMDPEEIKAIVGPDKAVFIPSKDKWEESFDRDIIVEEVATSKSEQEQAWEYGSRQGTWEKMVANGMMPPKIFVKMIPSGWLKEEDRQEWLTHLQQKEAAEQAQQAPPAADPNAPPPQGGQ